MYKVLSKDIIENEILPHPVSAGQLIHIDLGRYQDMAEEFQVEIYSLSGAKISNTPIRSSDSKLYAPNIPSTYILRISSKQVSKKFILIVN